MTPKAKELCDHSSLIFTPAAILITTEPIELYGCQTINGVELKQRHTVLVNGQHDMRKNGIYNVNEKHWKRIKDFKEDMQFRPGLAIRVAKYPDTKDNETVIGILTKHVRVSIDKIKFEIIKVKEVFEPPFLSFIDGEPYTKPCYGCYGENACLGHHGCPIADGCYAKTAYDKGPCDCPYKHGCHISRQKLQVEYRREINARVEDCDFYKMSKKNETK